MNRSDETLVRSIGRGSTAALEEFYERYAAKAHNLAWSITKDGSLAEESVSDAFIQLWRYAKGFRGAAKARSWFYRIVVNASFMTLRARKTKLWKDIDLVEDVGLYVPHPGPSPLDACSNEQLRAGLDQAIKDLDPIYQTVFILRDMEGLTNEETSTALDLTIPAVKSRLHRARAELQNKMVKRKFREPSKKASNG